MTERITIQNGDYILLSDIPNEQVFDFVRECFVNAGFDSDSVWEDRLCWVAFYAGSWSSNGEVYSCFAGRNNMECDRQLSLSDVFNSTNGGFNWNLYTSPIAKVTPNGVRYFRELYCNAGIVLMWLSNPQETSDTCKISRFYDLSKLEHTNIEQVQGRVLGKSTAHHLELISKAMKKPEVWLNITSDHFDSKHCNKYAFEEVKVLCYKLGLDWMEFCVSSNSIRYMPYQTVRKVTKWERVE